MQCNYYFLYFIKIRNILAGCYSLRHTVFFHEEMNVEDSRYRISNDVFAG